MLILAADDAASFKEKSFMESPDWHDGVSFVTDANDPSQTIIKVYADGPDFEISLLVASIALPRRLANALAALIDVMPDEVARGLRGEKLRDVELLPCDLLP